MDDKNILTQVYDQLYKRDIDNSLNIFLCGADTYNKGSIRNLLNNELQKNARFNVVYPENIFAQLLSKKKHNLFELEDELAKYVDLIIIPLEGLGTLCELGAFVMNKELLPKIIVINNVKYKNKKSFVNLGPIDLINKNNIIYFTEGNESEISSSLIEKIKNKRITKKTSYDFDNFFNMSRYLLYLIAVFQPITDDKINTLTADMLDLNGINKRIINYIDSAIQILKQKNRIESDIDPITYKNTYNLSNEGHNFFYEELLEKLKVKQYFCNLRANIINNQYKPKSKDMSRDLKLLV